MVGCGWLAGFILSPLLASRLGSIRFDCMRVQHPRARLRACVRATRLPHTLVLFPSRSVSPIPCSPPPLHSSGVFPLVIQSILVAQSSVHSRSQEEADRLSQIFFLSRLFPVLVNKIIRRTTTRNRISLRRSTPRKHRKVLCLKRIVPGSSTVFIYLLVNLYVSLSKLKFF